MDKSKLEQSVQNLRQFQENLNKAAENTKSVKEGTMTPEEEKKEPSFMLYDHIAETSINILQLPTFEKGFAQIAAKIGDEATQSLAEMFAVAMTHSSYSAVIWYDQLLKEELGKQFDHMAKGLNDAIGTLNGHSGVLEVFKQKIGNIEKKLQIDNLLNEKK